MSRPGNRTFLVVGLLVALLLAGVVSYYASPAPDGLDRVAGDHGLAGTEREHAADGSPLAGYRAEGVEDDRLSTAVAGVTGALVVLGLFGGLTFLLRRRASADAHDRADRR
ncbi:MAG TPA: PDGLE domain-containing protein [Nocardioides sp.]|nr:PDGLE domain-containing protein [Nocardioides sp.]